MQLRRGNENRNSRCNLAIRFLHWHLMCLFCDSAMNKICDHTTAWLIASSNTHNNEKVTRCHNSHNYVTNTLCSWVLHEKPLSTSPYTEPKNPVHAISLRLIFILSSRLHLGIPSGLFLKNEFPQINVYWSLTKIGGPQIQLETKWKSRRGIVNCRLFLGYIWYAFHVNGYKTILQPIFCQASSTRWLKKR